MKCSANFKDFPSLAETLLLLAQTPPVSENNEDSNGRSEIVQPGTKEPVFTTEEERQGEGEGKGELSFSAVPVYF
jgi:hypothetical protein